MKMSSRDITFIIAFLSLITLIAFGYNDLFRNILTGLIVVYWGLDVRKKLRR